MDNRTIIQISLDYIEDHLQTDITAAELAEMAGFSLFHYYRLFQQATGLPVMQYILRRRLLHGVYAGFYKAFCREFGSTPSDFLESSRARRPYRIDITKEEHMTVTQIVAQFIQHRRLHAASIVAAEAHGDSDLVGGGKFHAEAVVGKEIGVILQRG